MYYQQEQMRDNEERHWDDGGKEQYLILFPRKCNKVYAKKPSWDLCQRRKLFFGVLDSTPTAAKPVEQAKKQDSKLVRKSSAGGQALNRQKMPSDAHNEDQTAHQIESQINEIQLGAIRSSLGDAHQHTLIDSLLALQRHYDAIRQHNQSANADQCVCEKKESDMVPWIWFLCCIGRQLAAWRLSSC
jgi:hypothetical protein